MNNRDVGLRGQRGCREITDETPSLRATKTGMSEIAASNKIADKRTESIPPLSKEVAFLEVENLGNICSRSEFDCEA